MSERKAIEVFLGMTRMLKDGMWQVPESQMDILARALAEPPVPVMKDNGTEAAECHCQTDGNGGVYQCGCAAQPAATGEWEIEQVIRIMVCIVEDPDAATDERLRALETIREALDPQEPVDAAPPSPAETAEVIWTPGANGAPPSPPQRAPADKLTRYAGLARSAVCSARNEIHNFDDVSPICRDHVLGLAQATLGLADVVEMLVAQVNAAGGKEQVG